MYETPKLTEARRTFEAALAAGTEKPRRGMVFRYLLAPDPAGTTPEYFVCRADLGDGRWVDPAGVDLPAGIVDIAVQVATGRRAFDGVDPAYTDTPEDIAAFGISPHADLSKLADRISGAEQTIRMQHAILTRSPELTFGEDGMALSGHIIAMMAAAHEDALTRSGVKNFLQMSFHSNHRPGHLILVTIRHSTGMTVEEKYLEWGRKLDEVAEEYRKCAPLARFDDQRAHVNTLRAVLEKFGRDPDAAAGALPSGVPAAELGLAPDDEEPEAGPSLPGLSERQHVDTKTSEMVCNGCEAREPLPKPLRLDRVVDVLTTFAAKHIDCGVKPTGDAT